MKYTSLFCAVLSCTLLAAPAMAAGGPALSPGADPRPAMDFSVPEQPGWTCRWGSIRSVEENAVLIRTGGAVQEELLCRLSAETVLLNAVTGETMSPHALREGDTIYFYGPPVLALSEPAQVPAALILAGIPAGYAVPSAQRVTRVDRDADGTTIHTSEVVYHVSGETECSGPRALDALIPGDYVAGWYTASTRSLPPQTTPERLVFLPGGQSGWMSAGLHSVSVNGSALALSPTETPQLHGEELMLPVRAVAQAAGFTVDWSPETPEEIRLSRDGTVLDALTLGPEGDAFAENGVTFQSLDRILGWSGLYFVP